MAVSPLLRNGSNYITGDKIIVKDNYGDTWGVTIFGGGHYQSASEIVFANNQGGLQGVRVFGGVATLIADQIKFLHNSNTNPVGLGLYVEDIINADSIIVSQFGTNQNTEFTTGNIQNKNGFDLPYLRYLFSTGGSTTIGYTANITGG